MNRVWITLLAVALLAPGLLGAQGKGKVVEEIIARVNNEIITLSDYRKAEATLKEEVTQDCQNCPADRVAALLKDREKNLLRDLIDQSLLTQRAKDDDINVEGEVVKRLDEVRQQNNLPSLEELEKAVESQGVSWEDYKSGIRNQLLTQEVVHREVGPRITIGHDEVKKFYDDHQNDFVRPENVVLAEISLNTDGKTPDEVAAIKKKAEDLRDRLKRGDDFNELAKRYSNEPSSPPCFAVGPSE